MTDRTTDSAERSAADGASGLPGDAVQVSARDAAARFLGSAEADLRAVEGHLGSLVEARRRLDEQHARAVEDRERARLRVGAARAELARLDVPVSAPAPRTPASSVAVLTGASILHRDPYATATPGGHVVPGPPGDDGSGPALRTADGQGGRRPVPAAVLLLGVGAVLLLSAAAVFVALSWRGLGVAGQAGVLVGATAAAAVTCALLRRARLQQGAEALAWVTAGLLLLDLVGARTFDLAGLGAVPVDVWTLVSAAVLAAVGTTVTVATAAPVAPVVPGPGTGTARPRLVAGALVAAASVPVALLALVVVVAGLADQVRDPDLASELLAGLVVGPLEGLVVAGLAGCLLALALDRPATRPAALVRASTRITGVVLVGLAGVLALVAAAALPWWWPDAGAGDDAVGAVVVRLVAAAVVAVALAVAPRVLSGHGERVVAAATAAAVTAGLLVALAALVGLPRDVGLLVTTAVLLPVVLVLRRGPDPEPVAFQAVQALRRGTSLVVLGLGVVGALLLVMAAVVALTAPQVADGDGWPVPGSLDVARTGATGAATLVLALLGSARGPHGDGVPAVLRVPRLDRWRADVATVGTVTAASTAWWAWLAARDLGRSWAGAAVVAVLLVTAVAVVAGRRRLRTSAWRLGPLSARSLLALVAVWTLHAVLTTIAAEEALRTDGLVPGGVLLLAGAGTLLVAVVVTPGGPRRPPAVAPDQPSVAAAPDLTLTAGVALVAAAAAVAAYGRPVLHGPSADAGLAALLVTAVAAMVLVRLPAWPGARTAIAGLGGAAVLIGLSGTVGLSGVSTVPLAVQGSDGLVGRAGLAWVVGGLAVALQAVAATAPRHGRVPVPPALRHVLLPGPLVVSGLGATAAAWPLVLRLPLDAWALPATVVLLVLAGYVAAAVHADPDGPSALGSLPRAIARDLLLPLLLGLAGATLVAATLPLLDPAVVDRPLLAWAAVPAALVLASSVALRRAHPALAASRPWSRDVVRPLAAAATLLLLLASLRPTTGLQAEVETIVVAAVGLLAHLVREALRSDAPRSDAVRSDAVRSDALRSDALGSGPDAAGAPRPVDPAGVVADGTAPTLRDGTTLLSASGLGALGVVLASTGDRPLWVAGLTWWVLGVSALAVVVLVPGPMAGPLPPRARSRAWWALRVGATASVAGWLLAAVDLDWPLERLTVPVGLVLTLFGLAALRVRRLGSRQETRPGDGAPGTLRLLGPGLALALAPSAFLAVVDPVAPRPLVVAVAGSLLVALGAWRRWQAPLLVGVLAVVPVAVVQALPFVVSVPQWVYLAAAGVLALAVGVTFERAKQRAQEAGRQWRELR